MTFNSGGNAGKENGKLSRRDDYFSDMKDNALSFVDPAFSIFDMSTPKYKMTPVEDHGTSTSFWENSFLRGPDTKIIDYMSNINARDPTRADVNIETPTRPVPIRLDMNTPDSHESNSFLTKNVIKALNFGASIDGDMSVIMRETDESINVLSDGDEDEAVLPKTSSIVDPRASQEETTKTLAAPTKDTSPDSAVLKESVLKGELLSKFVLTSPSFSHHTANTKQTCVISPVKEKEECEFTQRLTANIGYTDNDERDFSFVDALSNQQRVERATGPHQAVTQHQGSPSRVERSERNISPSRPDKKVSDPDPKEDLDEWKETKTAQGKTYFYNRRTRQSAWQ
jgi:hypothetical protein